MKSVISSILTLTTACLYNDVDVSHDDPDNSRLKIYRKLKEGILDHTFSCEISLIPDVQSKPTDQVLENDLPATFRDRVTINPCSHENIFMMDSIESSTPQVLLMSDCFYSVDIFDKTHELPVLISSHHFEWEKRGDYAAASLQVQVDLQDALDTVTQIVQEHYAEDEQKGPSQNHFEQQSPSLTCSERDHMIANLQSMIENDYREYLLLKGLMMIIALFLIGALLKNFEMFRVRRKDRGSTHGPAHPKLPGKAKTPVKLLITPQQVMNISPLSVEDSLKYGVGKMVQGGGRARMVPRSCVDKEWYEKIRPAPIEIQRNTAGGSDTKAARPCFLPIQKKLKHRSLSPKTPSLSVDTKPERKPCGTAEGFYDLQSPRANEDQIFQNQFH